jgi:flagellar capping protein FliD
MDLYVDPYSGSIKLIQDSITANTTSIKERLDAIDSRFERQKEILEKKFNALELLISTSNMTKNWLTQQVNYMTKQR